MADSAGKMAAKANVAAATESAAWSKAMELEVSAAAAAKHHFTVARAFLPHPPELPSFSLYVAPDVLACCPRATPTAGRGPLLRIDKRTRELVVDAEAAVPADALETKIVAVLGVMHVHAEAFLLVVTEAAFVGAVRGAAVWGVRKVQFHALERMASPAEGTRDAAVRQDLASLEVALSQHGYYFSYDWDLSRPVAIGGEMEGMAFDEAYCWNAEMALPLRALPAPHDRAWAVPLIHGACHAERLEDGDVMILARRCRPLLRSLAAPEEAVESMEVEAGEPGTSAPARCREWRGGWGALCVHLMAEMQGLQGMQGGMVSAEVSEALVASGGNVGTAAERAAAGHGASDGNVVDRLLDLMAAQQAQAGAEGSDGKMEGVIQRTRSATETLELTLEKLCKKCVLNLYRQATGSDPPDNGNGAAAARDIAARLVAASDSLTGSQPWHRLLTDMASERSRAMAAQWRCHGQLLALHERVWEEQSVRLCCTTWNANGKVQPQAAVREWLRGAEDLWGEAGAEIYVVGLQEAVELDAMNLMADAGSLVRAAGPGDGAYVDAKGRTTALGAWRARVEAALHDVGGGLELVAARQLVGIMLFVLAAPHIRPLIADVEVDSVRTGLGGMAGNKGAIGVQMTVGLSTVCFVCAHLAAHKKNTAERNSNYHAIINGLAFGAGAGAGGAAGDPGDLPRRARAALSGQGAVPSAHVLRQDDVVVFGDLNYRLEGAADAAAVAQMVAEGRIEELRAFDQLEGERRAGRPFCCATYLPI